MIAVSGHEFAQYGYFAVFALLVLGIVGAPVPDEILLLYAGYNVSHGRLGLAATLILAWLGSVCGITLSFVIGRYIGLAAVRRLGHFVHVDDKSLAAARGWFQRWGKWTLLFGYFVPGFRHIVAIVAGTSRLRWRGFAPFAYTGALVWSSSFILTGYFIGEEAPRLADEMHDYLRAISIAAVLLAALAWIGWRTLIAKRAI
jgi:membrane protein DedA with SNARE-associated domain